MARILLVGEATWLQTGYATYAAQIASKLQASGHEVGELACYGSPDDSRRVESPWPAFFVTTNQDNYPPLAINQSNPALGCTVFEETVLLFRPDVVISLRDPWQDSFIAHSPLRHYYRWVFMHPVDGEPQDDEWIAILGQADAVLTYSEYGLEVLRKYPGLNLAGVASPGAEPDIFYAQDRKESHEALAIPQGALVVGTVMRNQARKLFPDLFESFRKLLDTAPSHIASRLYLYCHTSWPDVGWDLPKYLIKHGIGHRTLFTFACRSCERASSLLWQLPAGYCPFCASGDLFTPTASSGLPRSFMRSVYSSMDIFVQYSVCEGFGMPQVEAACCGIPVISVDFTAMSSVASAIGAETIPVQRTFPELETGRELALPDNNALVASLANFFSLPPAARRAKGQRQKDMSTATFSYSKAGDVWLKTIEGLDKPSKSYKDKKRILPVLVRPHEHLSNKEWVDKAFSSAFGVSTALVGYIAQRIIRDLSRGYCDTTFVPSQYTGFGPGGKLGGFTRDHAWAQLCGERERIEFWETKRTS